MKKYPGMYKQYFELKSNDKAGKYAEELRSSISSISLNNLIGKQSAFIVYCDELLQELNGINEKNLTIWWLADQLPSVVLQQFFRQAMIEEIHQTNDVENIHSTRKEIKDELTVIENGKKGKRFDGMIRKYQLLLQNEDIPLANCQDIRSLYDSFVLEEVVKENPKDIPDGLFFRKGPVTVVKYTNTIHEGVFPESALNEAMENALAFLNEKEYDPLIRIAAFHYLFGYIHPFYNGNGRMSRFISSYVLSSMRIHYLVSLRLSYVIKSHRAQYYNLFKTTNDPRNYGDLTRFVVEFLRYVREACEQVALFLSEKKDLINHYQEIIHKTDFDDDTKQLLFILAQVSICESDSLSIKRLSDITDMSYYLLNKRLELLKGYLEISVSGRSQLYRADLQKLDEL